MQAADFALRPDLGPLDVVLCALIQVYVHPRDSQLRLGDASEALARLSLRLQKPQLDALGELLNAALSTTPVLLPDATSESVVPGGSPFFIKAVDAAYAAQGEKRSPNSAWLSPQPKRKHARTETGEELPMLVTAEADLVSHLSRLCKDQSAWIIVCGTIQRLQKHLGEVDGLVDFLGSLADLLLATGPADLLKAKEASRPTHLTKTSLFGHFVRKISLFAKIMSFDAVCDLQERVSFHLNLFCRAVYSDSEPDSDVEAEDEEKMCSRAAFAGFRSRVPGAGLSKGMSQVQRELQSVADMLMAGEQVPSDVVEEVAQSAIKRFPDLGIAHWVLYLQRLRSREYRDAKDRLHQLCDAYAYTYSRKMEGSGKEFSSHLEQVSSLQLAVMHAVLGHVPAAREHLLETLRVAQQYGDTAAIGLSLTWLQSLSCAEGTPSSAKTGFGMKAAESALAAGLPHVAAIAAMTTLGSEGRPALQFRRLNRIRIDTNVIASGSMDGFEATRKARIEDQLLDMELDLANKRCKAERRMWRAACISPLERVCTKMMGRLTSEAAAETQAAASPDAAEDSRPQYDSLRRVLPSLDSGSSLKERSMALFELARISYGDNDIDQAESLLDIVLPMLAIFEGECSGGVAEAWLLRAKCGVLRQSYEDAAEAARRAAEIYQALKETRKEAKALHLQACILRKLGSYDLADAAAGASLALVEAT
mmetsp:Transcript_6689/g.25818  ORF Transcript_6689/g.25818 Transcript_6689/m.25818 type:complete len:706 (-) Transcript_6689:3057-5174(-)